VNKSRCQQCWRKRKATQFVGKHGQPVKRCKKCRREATERGTAERMSVPRRALRVLPAEPQFIWSDKSNNRKLGDIAACLVSSETCPPACGLYGRGCYAEFGIMGYHWRRTQNEGIGWGDLLGKVAALPPGALWRYATAGDLPGTGNALDIWRLEELALANAGRRGFTFTHKPLTAPGELAAIRRANRSGFTINLSADNLAHADRLLDLGVAPLAVVLPELETGARLPDRTPGGRRLVVCPAQTAAELDCGRCGLCARAERRGVVGFHAHGQMRHTVSKIARAS